ncbi:G-protein-signaling modulator 2 [Sardina pilchardus]|uniref:G-protein-signaling modulator 2 n=1 Tax=Sardina pilchardus TaxID=27697 RepID=UPI002E116E09
MDMAVDGQSTRKEDLEPLFILEEGDDIGSVMCNTSIVNSQETVKKIQQDSGDTIKENHLPVEQLQESTTCESEDGTVKSNMQEEEREGDPEKGTQREMETKDSAAADIDVNRENEAMQRTEESVPDEPPAVGEGASHMQTTLQGTDATAETKTEVVLRHKTQPSAETTKKCKDFLSPDDAQKKVNRLSSDFPDALYELVYSVQEGRRLNDQRCSFRLEGRRRCYSEPGTPRHSNRVMFSSMTSLQKEEFFDLVATSQARRLDDQRAEPESIIPIPPQPQPPPAPPANEPKACDRKLSIRASVMKKATKAPPPKDDLYNMILTSQAQGRLEEQRSRAPGPMDDEDFFSLLLKVQGGRMEEQRTEFPDKY